MWELWEREWQREGSGSERGKDNEGVGLGSERRKERVKRQKKKKKEVWHFEISDKKVAQYSAMAFTELLTNIL